MAELQTVSLFGLEILRPLAAPVLLTVQIFAGVCVLGLLLRRQELSRFVFSAQLSRFLPAYSPVRAAVRAVLACAGFAFLALALLGPAFGFTEREVRLRGLDLVVCIDTSRSMLATDLRPDRLTRAKREVRGLLESLAGDRVALVAFSGDTRDVAPLTHDRFALEGLLQHVSPEDNRMGGTDLGAALEHALALFDGRTGAHEAVVLITDGEDLSGRGRKVAAEAEERGIRVYVVGIGTRAGSKIPIGAAEGGQAFLVGPGGEEVVTRLEDDTLRELARMTGGEYLSTEESSAPLEELYEKRIARIGARELEGGLERVPHDRYQWFLIAALAFMLGETALRERRPVGRGRASTRGGVA